MSRRSRIKRNPEKYFVKYGKKFANLFPGFEKSLESIGITPEVFDKAMQSLGETLTKNSEPKEAEVEEVAEEKVEEKPTTQRKTRKATSTTTKKTTRKRSTTTKKATTTRKPRTTKTKKEE